MKFLCFFIKFIMTIIVFLAAEPSGIPASHSCKRKASGFFQSCGCRNAHAPVYPETEDHPKSAWGAYATMRLFEIILAVFQKSTIKITPFNLPGILITLLRVWNHMEKKKNEYSTKNKFHPHWLVNPWFAVRLQPSAM